MASNNFIFSSNIDKTTLLRESNGILHLPVNIRMTFLFLGVGSIIGWNAILIGLDFFLRKFSGFDVGFYFLIPMFIALNLQNIMIQADISSDASGRCFAGVVDFFNGPLGLLCKCLLLNFQVKLKGKLWYAK